MLALCYSVLILPRKKNLGVDDQISPTLCSCTDHAPREEEICWLVWPNAAWARPMLRTFRVMIGEDTLEGNPKIAYVHLDGDILSSHFYHCTSMFQMG